MHELAITLAPQRRRWHRRNTEESSLQSLLLCMCDRPVPVCQARNAVKKDLRDGNRERKQEKRFYFVKRGEESEKGAKVSRSTKKERENERQLFG